MSVNVGTIRCRTAKDLDDEDKIVGQGRSTGATITPGRPPTVEELAEREGLDPIELLRREFENKRAGDRKEAAIASDLSALRLLMNARRQLRTTTKMREDIQRVEKQQLAEVEREIEAIRQRLPPRLIKTIE